MNVCVVGMWHLGSVTAACLASLGHRVIGLDSDEGTVAALGEGRAPLFEPGLDELIREQEAAGTLSFSSDPREAVSSADVIWIAYDTPVDDDDVADVDGVLADVAALFPHLREGAVMLISSQLIAGCTRRLQERWNREHPGKAVYFAYSPENLRLGKAIQVFMEPDRIVVGVNDASARAVIDSLLHPFADRILWMSVESAEMTKHALNAFLAMCVSFANEIAGICEQVGADGKEVERGLKSERRIGPSAYLAPGAAFAGGTLARDVQYLKGLAKQHGQSAALVSAIKDSNDRHRDWERRKLVACFDTLEDVKVAVLGLTYKPGTDTLRRSTSLELCRWLAAEGAQVVAHDPRVRELPAGEHVKLAPSVAAVLAGAQALVIATPWPEYGEITVDAVLSTMARPLVVDANRVAAQTLNVAGIEYLSVGTPVRNTKREA